MRILLVEDDEALCAAVAPLLEQEGYRVDVCRDGDDALYYMRQRMFGLCILDRMLPGRDGLSVLRAARAVRHKRASPRGAAGATPRVRILFSYSLPSFSPSSR